MNYYALTDIGKVRNKNQDQATVIANVKDQVIAIVCDGMGGHRAGEIASRVVMDQFVNCFDSIPPFDNVDELKKWVNETIYEADAIVKRMAKQNVEHHGMGTTIVVAILMDNVIYISHVGDSRAYVLKNENLYSVFSLAINIPVIIAMCITPMLVEKMKGLYRMNLAGYILGTAGRVGVIFAGYMGSVPLMLAFTAVAALGMAPWQGDMGAVVASCSEYTYLTKHKHIDGTMYSCTSFGTKIGGGIGVALCGWLLDASGFVKEATIQPESCLNMLHVMYLWIPMVLSLIITFIMSRMNVEDANKKLRKQLVEC